MIKIYHPIRQYHKLSASEDFYPSNGEKLLEPLTMQMKASPFAVI